MAKVVQFSWIILVAVLLLLIKEGVSPGAAQAQGEDTPTVMTDLQQTANSPSPTITLTLVPELTPTSPLPTNTLQPPTPIPSQANFTPTTEPVKFTVSGIEPSRITRETGGALSIYGGGFLPGMAVRLVGYGLLDTAVLNSSAIRAIVPPGLAEGRYTLEVLRSDGEMVRLNNAIRIRSGLPEPTATPKPGPLLAYAKPELWIQAAETAPDPVGPGGGFTLRLQLVNRGDYTATNIRIALVSTEQVFPKEGSNLVVLDKLAAQGLETVELPLVLNSSAQAGYGSLEIRIDYSDYYRRDYSSSQSVGLNVSDAAPDQPLVLLEAYHTEPATLSPGEAFTLHLSVHNVGESEAHQLLLTLGGEAGSSDQPFAIIGSGNVKFIPALKVGEIMEVEQRFILDGTADSGVYNLPVSLDYDGPEGAHRTASQMVNLMASRQPQLQVDFYDQVQSGRLGEPLELPVEVVNIGRSLVNISTITIDGESLHVEQASAYIGALDGGTSGSMDARVVPQESGALAVVVTVNYLDDFNQPQVFTHTLTIQVEQPQPTPDASMPAGEAGQAVTFWDRVVQLLRGLFGLGS